VSEQTAPDSPNRAENEAEAADRLRHGSSFGAARPPTPSTARLCRGRGAVGAGAGPGPPAGPGGRRRQARTADSLLATIGTHSHLLVMDEAERARLLARTGEFLRSQPETAHGEFTLPMVTVVLRTQRR
jgi:hypothetical protein